MTIHTRTLVWKVSLVGLSYYIRWLDPIVGDTEMTGEDPVCPGSRTVTEP